MVHDGSTNQLGLMSNVILTKPNQQTKSKAKLNSSKSPISMSDANLTKQAINTRGKKIKMFAHASNT